MTGEKGCTVCGTEDTATVDGVSGRRCATHPPAFQPDRAVELAVTGDLPSALAYCRTTFPGDPS